jgi:CDP-diacylglycerol pyrophosphatase
VHSRRFLPSVPRIVPIVVLSIFATAFLLTFITRAQAASRSTLWHIVHDRCVSDQERHGRPSPCAYVDLAGGERQGYAILKDRVGIAQVLLVPTQRVSGIESPEILTGDASDYWHGAWEARRYVFRRLGRSLHRDAVGMAVNSSFGRSQDQLHIHVDCLQPDVKTKLDARLADVRDTWSKLPYDVHGRRYWARRVYSADLQGINPFRMLYDLAKTNTNMARETLVVIGAAFGAHAQGFILLSDRANLMHGDAAHGEELLDHSCAISRT